MRHFSDDRGSLPLAMLAVIMITGFVAALVTYVIGSTRFARHDRAYTEVVQVSDAGAQAGVQYLLRAVPAEELADRPDGYTYTGSGSLDGNAYSWTATKNPRGDDPLMWEVESTSTNAAGANVGDVTRQVAIEIRDTNLFFVAAFSDRQFTLRGGNAADSYDIIIGSGATGNGIVGSNETIRLNGNTYVDGVQLHNFDALPDYARCDGRDIAGQCADLLDGIAPSGTFGPRLAVGVNQTLDTGFIDDQLANCPDPLPDFDATSNTMIGTTGATEVLCFDNFSIDRNVDVTVRGPVEIYVYGTISIGNQATLNCTACSTASRPDAADVQIFSDGDPVNIGNHSYVAAGIYAPESDCGGNPSNAQADIFGSLICGQITNQGGWAFHYDDQLSGIGTGNFTVSAWREE